MAKITDELKSKIIAQYKVGKSQNWLAKEYDVSPATINKICKGIEQDYKEKVNTVVSIKSELAGENEYISEYFDKEVNEQLSNKRLVYGVTQKALQKLEGMIDQSDNPNDIKTIIEASDRASLTLGVNPRHANSQINVTNTNAQQNSTTILTHEQMREELKRRGLPIEL